MDGTYLFNQLGSTVTGEPMAFANMPDEDIRPAVIAPRGPLARILQPHTPLDRIMAQQFGFEPNYDDLISQFSSFTGNLSESIRQKAKNWNVLHLVGRHLYQNNFDGGVDFDFSDLLDSEILAYNNFYQSLTPAEQDEFESFLGGIGRAIGSAAKAVGKAVGSAAKAVGQAGAAVGKTVAKGAVAVAHGVRNVGVGAAHVARDAGVGIAHIARDAGVGVAHTARQLGKYTWKNLPTIVAAATALIPGLGPEVAAGLLSAVAAMKAGGASDQQIEDYLNQQTGGAWTGGYDPNYDTSAYDYPDFPSAEDLDISPDDNGDINFPDGSVYNVNTGKLTMPDGSALHSDPSNAEDKETDWLMWGAIAAVVLLVAYYMYKKGYFKHFKFK